MVEKALDEVLELKPDRFAVFNYAHVPWMRPAQKLLERSGLPDARTKLELLKLCIERIEFICDFRHSGFSFLEFLRIERISRVGVRFDFLQ